MRNEANACPRTKNAAETDRTVSVAMATYNGAQYLSEQLQSLLKQTRLPDELVVSDDASTDDTLRIVEAFASIAPFRVIRSINAERLGFQDNFLKAASLCRGTYVAFCDQDDVWHRKKIELMCNALVTHGALMAVHGATITDESLRPLSRLQNGVAADGAFPPLSLQPFPGKVYGFTLMFDRNVLNYVDANLRPDVPGQPGVSLYHDVWIALLASTFGKTVHVARSLAYYRQHSTNALGAMETKCLTNVLQHFRSPIDHYRWRVEFARRYARALSLSVTKLRRPHLSRAVAAANFYETVAQTYEERSELIEHVKFSHRLRKIATMFAQGRYCRVAKGGLGRASMLKDMFSICFHALCKKRIGPTPRIKSLAKRKCSSAKKFFLAKLS